MRFLADLHIHSHYSRATSKDLTPVKLDYWAKIKGVNVVGTGDFTHPKWTEELKQALELAEDGLFKLKSDLVLDNPVKNPQPVRFLLSAEISNIYKKNGKVRKVHNVVLAPDFETVEKIQKALADRKFNITSDGRPILGMDSRDLLEMLLEIDERIFFIPAHIWTPWFAVLGSKSGFDSIEECFEDMTEYIYAVETGLSSDQPLNWLCSFLDRFSLVSNSDAHSPEKLGRNANIFNTQMSYFAIIEAMKSQTTNELEATIDLYPQEGKYHYDGHRKCNVRFDPVQTLEHNGICPVCGKPLTLGVAHRIASLADRDDPLQRPNRKKFYYLIPLKEILAEILHTGAASKKVDNQYFKIVSNLGNEFFTLLEADYDSIRKVGGDLLAEAIRRMRDGEVIIEEGFDGQYGVIRLFEKGEIEAFGSSSLFVQGKKRNYKQRPLLNFDVKKFRELKQQQKLLTEHEPVKDLKQQLNEQQQKAKNHGRGPALVIAGPGTGKTRILTERIAHLIKDLNINPQNILAITFTRQAAGEMQKRLSQLLDENQVNDLTISTFHALGLDILSSHFDRNFYIIDDNDKRHILSTLGVAKNQLSKYINLISQIKNTFTNPTDLDQETAKIFNDYQKFLEQNNLLDFDDLIYKTVNLLEENSDLRQQLQQKYQWILIDEFQDINLAQYKFLKLISSADKNLFAIGDPNQSIYQFRGSDNRLIQQFIEEFQPAIYKITTTYRVPQNIIDASLSVLRADHGLTSLTKGVKVVISPQATDKSEAEFIARQIEKLMGGVGFFSIDSQVSDGFGSKTLGFSDFAILVRTRHQFEAIERALMDHNLPYQVVGSSPFYLNPPYSQIIDVLKFLAYPENSFFRQKISHLQHVIQYLKTGQPLKQLVIDIAKILKISIDQIEKLLNIIEKNKFDLKQLLTFLEISYGQDEFNPDIESVALMTLHASKGLEFKVVFIPGLEDGLLPYTLYRDDVDIDEERRLLYVGMTRAKERLYLSYARRRMLFGRMLQLKPSRFLADIKRDLLEELRMERKKSSQDSQLKLF